MKLQTIQTTRKCLFFGGVKSTKEQQTQKPFSTKLTENNALAKTKVKTQVHIKQRTILQEILEQLKLRSWWKFSTHSNPFAPYCLRSFIPLSHLTICSISYCGWEKFKRHFPLHFRQTIHIIMCSCTQTSRFYDTGMWCWKFITQNPYPTVHSDAYVNTRFRMKHFPV